jgi:hypothetical protein
MEYMKYTEVFKSFVYRRKLPSRFKTTNPTNHSYLLLDDYRTFYALDFSDFYVEGDHNITTPRSPRNNNDKLINSLSVPENNKIQPHYNRRGHFLCRRSRYNDRQLTVIESVGNPNSELFYLRLILQHKPIRSFEDLFTGHNDSSKNFKQVAERNGWLLPVES